MKEEKVLKKLNRSWLLELLLEVIQENQELRAENKKLKENLESKNIAIKKAALLQKHLRSLAEYLKQLRRQLICMLKT